MVVSNHRATPNHHLFGSMGFYINHPAIAWGYPHDELETPMETPSWKPPYDYSILIHIIYKWTIYGIIHTYYSILSHILDSNCDTSIFSY